jgi:hypothetical protein
MEIEAAGGPGPTTLVSPVARFIQCPSVCTLEESFERPKEIYAFFFIAARDFNCFRGGIREPLQYLPG